MFGLLESVGERRDADEDGVRDAGEVKTTSYDWSYDDVGRLTDEVLDHWDNQFDQSESFTYDLTGNRLALDRDLGNDSTIDESIEYHYDANDRLFAELSDTANDTTTIYQYDHTQQTDKAVYTTLLDEATINSLADGGDDSSQQRVSAQRFGYNLQGRMFSVVNEGYDASGDLDSHQRTTYEYDSKSFRVRMVNEADTSLSLPSPTFSLQSVTEFLADHHNHTGYTQTIRETKTRADDSTQTIDYTFGHDEIAQRVHGTDEAGQPIDEPHVFGHDGHGSVRVLYDLAGTFEHIAQAFTFAAYGELLAVHGADAVAVPSTPRLTSLGYSGEHFDARAQQQYLRARWYDPSSGRFNRLDPFAGNMQDPQSLHKYAYVHGDPVGNIDPSGLVSLGGLSVSIGTSNNVRAQNQGVQTSALANSGRAIAHSSQRALANGVNVLRQSPHLVRQYNRQIAKHIIGRHTPPAGAVANAGKSLFRTSNPRIISNLIDKTLKTGRVAGNTGGRAGLTFTRTYNSPVGTNAAGQTVHTVKVVVSEAGKLITAFPI